MQESNDKNASRVWMESGGYLQRGGLCRQPCPGSLGTWGNPPWIKENFSPPDRLCAWKGGGSLRLPGGNKKYIHLPGESTKPDAQELKLGSINGTGAAEGWIPLDALITSEKINSFFAEKLMP